MRLVKARGKQVKDFPPQEKCCDVVTPMHLEFAGCIMVVDLDDTMDYRDLVGHCGQPLGFNKGVKVVESSYANDGYVPFELIDIDEGASA